MPPTRRREARGAETVAPLCYQDRVIGREMEKFMALA